MSKLEYYEKEQFNILPTFECINFVVSIKEGHSCSLEDLTELIVKVGNSTPKENSSSFAHTFTLSTLEHLPLEYLAAGSYIISPSPGSQ